MPRLSKEREAERREKLISIAKESFLKNGYENTTVGQIIGSLNLAKGTFYYHFKSKEHILVAVSERLINETYNKLQTAHQRNDIDSLEQLKQMLTIFHDDFYRNRNIWSLVYNDENIALYKQVTRTAGKCFTPLLADVLKEGVEAGLIDIPHPREFAEVLMTVLDLFSRQLCARRNPESRRRVFETLRCVISRIIGDHFVPLFTNDHA